MMNIGREMWLNKLNILYVLVYYNILGYLYAGGGVGKWGGGGVGVWLRDGEIYLLGDILRLLFTRRRALPAVGRLVVKVWRRLPALL